MKRTGIGGVVDSLLNLAARRQLRPSARTSLLCVLLFAVAAWGVHSVYNGGSLREVVEEVEHSVGIDTSPHKHKGTGAVSVTKSTDLSKPGGGVITEDESWKEGLGHAGQSPRPSGVAAGERTATRVNFASFRDGHWVNGVGTVRRVLGDDLVPPRHQRFILEDEFGNTVLVAHNIDQAARLQNLVPGDEVAFRGEYRVNAQGGVIHWTHPDSSRRRQGGWLYKK